MVFRIFYERTLDSSIHKTVYLKNISFHITPAHSFNEYYGNKQKKTNLVIARIYKRYYQWKLVIPHTYTNTSCMIVSNILPSFRYITSKPNKEEKKPTTFLRKKSKNLLHREICQFFTCSKQNNRRKICE